LDQTQGYRSGPKFSGRIEFSPGTIATRIFWGCVAVEIFIVLADIFLNRLHWIPFRPLRKSFNITREDSISNWFSATQPLVTAAILFLLYLQSGRKRGWAILSAFFAYMAIDDAIQFHERAGSSLDLILYDTPLPTYGWHFVFAVPFGAMGLYIVWFLYRELRSEGTLGWLFAALTALVIAVAMDAVEGLEIPLLSSDAVGHYLKAIEETLEMFGNTCFLVLFLRTFLERIGTISFNRIN